MSNGETSTSHTLQEQVLAPPWGALGRSVTLGVVSTFARLVLTGLNKTDIINQEALIGAIENRKNGAGVLTVCNHTRCYAVLCR
jgi:monolysocardiolipin acyltransferase